MFYYVYVLENLKNNALYIGHTTRLAKRFSEHNRGENPSTKFCPSWHIIHCEAYLNEKDAR